MIIKNPYRITEYIGAKENIPTTKGIVLGNDWCKAEAQRLRSNGIPAKAVKRGAMCYVVRNAEGCTMDPQDADIAGTDSTK